MHGRHGSSFRIVGTKQVHKALLSGLPGKLLWARDADPALTEPLLALAQMQGAETEEVSTMRALGAQCGIEVGAACAWMPRNP